MVSTAPVLCQSIPPVGPPVSTPRHAHSALPATATPGQQLPLPISCKYDKTQSSTGRAGACRWQSVQRGAAKSMCAHRRLGIGHQRSQSRRQPLTPPSYALRFCHTDASRSSTSTTITCARAPASKAYRNLDPQARLRCIRAAGKQASSSEHGVTWALLGCRVTTGQGGRLVGRCCSAAKAQQACFQAGPAWSQRCLAHCVDAQLAHNVHRHVVEVAAVDLHANAAFSSLTIFAQAPGFRRSMPFATSKPGMRCCMARAVKQSVSGVAPKVL